MAPSPPPLDHARHVMIIRYNCCSFPNRTHIRVKSFYPLRQPSTPKLDLTWFFFTNLMKICNASPFLHLTKVQLKDNCIITNYWEYLGSKVFSATPQGGHSRMAARL